MAELRSVVRSGRRKSGGLVLGDVELSADDVIDDVIEVLDWTRRPVRGRTHHGNRPWSRNWRRILHPVNDNGSIEKLLWSKHYRLNKTNQPGPFCCPEGYKRDCLSNVCQKLGVVVVAQWSSTLLMIQGS